MSRRHLTFACEDDTLAGTLDEAPGTSGLLLVTGGNEIRSGAFAGQAQLAARIAAAGFPVFRFDRRGVGDSSGANRGFRDSGADIAAALASFHRECPALARVIGFGNCDAASALMLGAGCGCDALVLANPWTIEHDDGAPPPAAIRERYAAKLRDPKELVRLATGKVSLRKLAGGLGRVLRPAPRQTSLAREIADRLKAFTGPVDILLAERDRTAQAFLGAWDADDQRLERCPGASHAFVEPEAREWLFARIVEALRSTGGSEAGLDARLSRERIVADMERRLPVWHALSDLFLDTEIRPEDYRRIADILKTSGYQHAELRTILEDEVAPAFVFNLLDVAGEWCSWSAEQVQEIMLQSLESGGGLPPMKSLRRQMYRRHIAGEWSKLESLLRAS